MRYRLAALLLFVAPLPLAGQERGGLPALPDEVEDRIEALRADGAAEHITGPVTIPADRTIAADLVVEDGDLELQGRVTGDVLVVRGDLILAPGASIGGDVLVIGGEITGAEDATVGGTLLTYGPATDEWHDDDKHAARDDKDWDDDDDEWDDHDGDDDGGWRHRHDHDDDDGLDLGLSIAGNYNRVEGLPVMFGPVVETAGPNRLHISGQAI